MNIAGYLSGEELTNANVIKEEVIKALEREGLLKVPASDIMDRYTVVMHKRGWLGNALAGLFGGDEKTTTYKVNILKVV